MSTLNNHLDINALIEMGFSKERVEQALNATNNKGIQPAIEWLFAHPVADADSGQKLGGPSNIDNGQILNKSKNITHIFGDAQTSNENTDGGSSITQSTVPSQGQSPNVALSLKCEDCGKQIRNEMDAQAHAARTGHQNFVESSEEIKPLTAEEKAEQKIRLQKKLEGRRNQRLEDEKKKIKESEMSRRRTGKEKTQAKEQHALLEMKKIADERRKEKLEEKRLKQKLKEDIQRDRAELKAKQTKSSSSTATTSTAKSQTPANIVKREYDSCRIQFRLTDGSTHNSNFKADDLLLAVHTYISTNRTDGNMPFTLSTTFPRKTFSDDDMMKTLKQLGLLPSAVLVLGKCS